MPTVIRRCIADDLLVAAGFLSVLYADRPQDAQLEKLPTRLSEFSLVAEKDGLVVGLLIAERRSTCELINEIGRDAFPGDDCYLEIQDLFVVEAERGQGIGLALVRDVLARAKAAGINRSMVYSANADYVRIARFYEQCGFKMWHMFMTR